MGSREAECVDLVFFGVFKCCFDGFFDVDVRV